MCRVYASYDENGTYCLEFTDISYIPPKIYYVSWEPTSWVHNYIFYTTNKVFMFLKVTFLEGQTRYNKLFSQYPPKKIYVFSKRISCAGNGEFERFPSSAVAYAWYVWEKGFTGDTVVKWI